MNITALTILTIIILTILTITTLFTMDNLKFTAIELESESSDKIKVSTSTYQGVTYSTEICNFLNIQKPSAILVPIGCMRYILNNINNCTYEEEKKGGNLLLHLCIPNFPEYRIELTLHKKQSEELDYASLILELRQKIDDMDPWEPIDILDYPSWDSYSEFKELPDFKYINTWANKGNYLQSCKMENRGSKYAKTSYIIEENLDIGYNTPTCDIKRWPVVLDSMEIGSFTASYNVYSFRKIFLSNELPEMFSKSVDRQEAKKLVDKNSVADTEVIHSYINPVIAVYFKYLLRGWIIRNVKLYKEHYENNRRSIILKAILNMDNLTLTIKRKKEKPIAFINCFDLTHIMFDLTPSQKIGNANREYYDKPCLHVLCEYVLIYKGHKYNQKF